MACFGPNHRVMDEKVIWQCRHHQFDLSKRPLIMGILNVTPDSFSDGGKYAEPDVAVDRALEMIDEGADIIDIGGESSRPGAEFVEAEQEIRRVAPVIERLRGETDIAISIDTYKVETAKAAFELGADILNDISGLNRDELKAELLAAHGAGAVIMHMQGSPKTMQQRPHYENVIAEIFNYLEATGDWVQKAGVSTEQIAFDPGLGFGKTFENNLEIMAGLDAFQALNRPLLIGVSRKSFIRKILGISLEDMAQGVPAKLESGSLAAAILLLQRGASIIRTHEIRATRVACDVYSALKQPRNSG